MLISRRNMLLGLIAAPAIVRASSLMPVKAWEEDTYWAIFDGYRFLGWQGEMSSSNKIAELLRTNNKIIEEAKRAPR